MTNYPRKTSAKIRFQRKLRHQERSLDKLKSKDRKWRRCDLSEDLPAVTSVAELDLPTISKRDYPLIYHAIDGHKVWHDNIWDDRWSDYDCWCPCCSYF